MYQTIRERRSLIWNKINPANFLNEIFNHSGRIVYETQVRCPYHMDKDSLSMCFNTHEGIFYCQACGKFGDFIQLVKDKYNFKNMGEAVDYLANNDDNDYNINNISNNNINYNNCYISKNGIEWTFDEVLDRHNRLVCNPYYIDMLKKYGIIKCVIDQFKLGIEKSGDCVRMTIPVINEKKKLISVKKHRIYGNKTPKAYSVRGSCTYLYPITSILNSDKILLLEGEPDVLAAISSGVNKYITPACSTGGCKTFKPEWSNFFKNKRVYICYDNDVSGIDGAINTYKILSKVCDVDFLSIPLPYKDMREYLSFLKPENARDIFKKLL